MSQRLEAAFSFPSNGFGRMLLQAFAQARTHAGFRALSLATAAQTH
jgi:hypothetical protein